MTYAEFKAFVCAALQRPSTAFVVGSVDLLDQAINMARRNIERKRDFELAKTLADVTLTTGSSAALSTAVVSGTATPVSIKTILRAQLSVDGTNFFPVGYTSRAAHMNALRRAYEGQDPTQNPILVTKSKISVVRYADEVYLSPSDSDSLGGAAQVTLRFDVVKWLSDYSSSAGSATDFLLTYCVDYMLLETYRYLQRFIKEDVRIQTTDDQLAIAWQAVVAWDSNLVVGDSDDANLD